MTVTVNIDMDRKCAECGKPGAVDSGICLKCTVKALSMKPMKSPAGQGVQTRAVDARAQFVQEGK